MELVGVQSFNWKIITEILAMLSKKTDCLHLRLISAFLLIIFGGLLSGADSFPLDISSAVNMGFKDDIADDGLGGWTDQGPENDLSAMRMEEIVCGVRFKIIDPLKNNGKSCIFSGRPDKGTVTRETVLNPGSESFKYIYVLHALAWAPQNNQTVGKILAVYKDGHAETIDVVSGRDVGNWRRPGTLPNGTVVWKTGGGASKACLYASKFKIDSKNLQYLKFIPAGNAAWLILAVSVSSEDIPVELKDDDAVPAGTRLGKPILFSNNYSVTANKNGVEGYSICFDSESSGASGGAGIFGEASVEWKIKGFNNAEGICLDFAGDGTSNFIELRVENTMSEEFSVWLDLNKTERRKLEIQFRSFRSEKNSIPDGNSIVSVKFVSKSHWNDYRSGKFSMNVFSIDRAVNIDRNSKWLPSGAEDIKILEYLRKHGVAVLSAPSAGIERSFETQVADYLRSWQIPFRVVSLEDKSFPGLKDDIIISPFVRFYPVSLSSVIESAMADGRAVIMLGGMKFDEDQAEWTGTGWRNGWRQTSGERVLSKSGYLQHYVRGPGGLCLMQTKKGMSRSLVRHESFPYLKELFSEYGVDLPPSKPMGLLGREFLSKDEFYTIAIDGNPYYNYLYQPSMVARAVAGRDGAVSALVSSGFTFWHPVLDVSDKDMGAKFVFACFRMISDLRLEKIAVLNVDRRVISGSEKLNVAADKISVFGAPEQVLLYDNSGKVAGRVPFFSASGTYQFKDKLPTGSYKLLAPETMNVYPEIKLAFSGSAAKTWNYVGLLKHGNKAQIPDMAESRLYDAVELIIPWKAVIGKRGTYDFSSLDEAVSMAEKSGFPIYIHIYIDELSWLPNTWNVTSSFKRWSYHDKDFVNTYQELLCTAVKRYSDRKIVAGWMLSDLGGEVILSNWGDWNWDYGPLSTAAWRDWLKNERKLSLEEVSALYKTSFSSWTEIEQPRMPTVFNAPSSRIKLFREFTKFREYTVIDNWILRMSRAVRNINPEIPLIWKMSGTHIRHHYLNGIWLPSFLDKAREFKIVPYSTSLENRNGNTYFLEAESSKKNMRFWTENGFCPLLEPAYDYFFYMAMLCSHNSVWNHYYAWWNTPAQRNGFANMAPYVEYFRNYGKPVDGEPGLFISKETTALSSSESQELILHALLSVQRNPKILTSQADFESFSNGILLDAFSYYVNREELDSIKRYVHAGGTFVAFAGSLRYMSDDDNEKTYAAWKEFSLDLEDLSSDIKCGTAPLNIAVRGADSSQTLKSGDLSLKIFSKQYGAGKILIVSGMPGWKIIGHNPVYDSVFCDALRILLEREKVFAPVSVENNFFHIAVRRSESGMLIAGAYSPLAKKSPSRLHIKKHDKTLSAEIKDAFTGKSLPFSETEEELLLPISGDLMLYELKWKRK